jgi:ribosomal protein L35AE/L33A
MNQTDFQAVVGNLPQTSAFDLYRLAHVVRTFYTEPKRVLNIRLQLHVGQIVSYFESQEGTMQVGRITAMNDFDCTVEDTVRQLRYPKLPYAAVDCSATPLQPQQFAQAAPKAAEQQSRVPDKRDFLVGGRVSFVDRDGGIRTGTIKRINARTASVVVDHSEGYWRVGFSQLRHLVDI